MANYFPSESGSYNVRGDLSYTTTQTATKVTLNVSAILQVNGVYGSGYELTIKVNGTTEKSVIGHKNPPAVAGWTTFLQTGNVSKEYTRTNSNQTVTIVASFVGKKSGDYFAGSGSGSKTITITVPKLDTPTVSQSLSSKTGSTVTIAWTSNMTIDSVWYSINGGTSWVSAGSVNSSSGSYTITGLSGGTSYSIKTRLRGKDSQLTTDSSALSVTTYSAPTISQSLNSKTDTTIKIDWSSNTTCEYLWYSKNGGSSWTAIGAINASSGSFTISSLSADTSYSIKTRVRGKNSQLTKDSSALSVTTYGYPTVSQSVSSKTANSITIAWSSNAICDYVWYSKNGGSSWTSVGSVNAASGSYTISSLSTETTYQIITRLRRKDSQYTADSKTLSVTTYGYPTVSQTLSQKTETTITIAWESQSVIDYLWYSTDNGTTWTGYNNTDGKSGTYTISGLSAYTNYKVKTRLRRKDSQLTKDSSALSITTYDYPHPTKAPSFTIGNDLTVTIYNPLGRSVTITIIAADNTTQSTSAITGTSFTGFKSAGWLSFWYSSIPNSTSGTYTVKTTYGSVERTMQGGTYSVNQSENKPTMGTFDYRDVNTTTTDITQNIRKIVQNLSIVRYSLASVSAQNSAIISSVSVSVNGQTYALSVSGAYYVGGNAAIDSGSNVTATVTVTDSRGLTAKKSITIQMLAWSTPSAIISLSRLSNFYTETYLKVDAVYSSVDGKNTISIAYTGNAVPQTGKTTPAAVSGTLSDNVQITLQLNNEFDWRFTITLQDIFGQTIYSVRLPRGTPIMFWDDIKNSVGVVGFPSHDNSIEIPTGDLYLKTEDVYGALFYKAGDTFSTLMGMVGYCTSSSTTIVFRVQMPKSIKNVSATLNSFTGRIRHVNGGYADGVTGDWMEISGVTVSVSKSNNSNELIFTIDKGSETFKRSSTSTTAITTDTPVFGTITPNISFS